MNADVHVGRHSLARGSLIGIMLLVLTGPLRAQDVAPRFSYPPAPYDDPSSITKWEDIYVSDALFDIDVYDQLDDIWRGRRETVDAKLVDSDGAGLSRADVAPLALERLILQAKAVGIEENQITKAIFEGQYNPPFEDLLLAWEGLKPPGSMTLEDLSPDRVEHLVEVGIAEPGQVPPDLYIHGAYIGLRNELWNKRFGSLGSVGDVTTIVDGQEQTMTPMDIGLCYLQRIKGEHFEGNFGLHRDPRMTFVQAQTELAVDQGREERAEHLEFAIRQVIERESVLSLFRMGSTREDDPFNFSRYYRDLREQRYVPHLKRSHFASLVESGVIDGDDIRPTGSSTEQQGRE